MKSKLQRSFAGFMVIEKSEEWEQPLGLEEDPAYPPGGLLTWTDGRRAVFLSRKDAREAITRTDHYGKAFAINGRSLPEGRFCKIVPVETITVKKP